MAADRASSRGNAGSSLFKRAISCSSQAETLPSPIPARPAAPCALPILSRCTEKDFHPKMPSGRSSSRSKKSKSASLASGSTARPVSLPSVRTVDVRGPPRDDLNKAASSDAASERSARKKAEAASGRAASDRAASERSARRRAEAASAKAAGDRAASERSARKRAEAASAASEKAASERSERKKAEAASARAASVRSASESAASSKPVSSVRGGSGNCPDGACAMPGASAARSRGRSSGLSDVAGHPMMAATDVGSGGYRSFSGGGASTGSGGAVKCSKSGCKYPIGHEGPHSNAGGSQASSAGAASGYGAGSGGAGAMVPYGGGSAGGSAAGSRAGTVVPRGSGRIPDDEYQWVCTTDGAPLKACFGLKRKP
jgi:hypothetical protein